MRANAVPNMGLIVGEGQNEVLARLGHLLVPNFVSEEPCLLHDF